MTDHTLILLVGSNRADPELLSRQLLREGGEVNNRPGGVKVPLQGIPQLMGAG
jgi:hypothetical protein